MVRVSISLRPTAPPIPSYANTRRAVVTRYLWNARDQAFEQQDWREGRFTGRLVEKHDVDR